MEMIAAEMYPCFLMVNPALKAPSVAGKNEIKPKIAPAGFMNMPMTEPISTAIPPVIGPSSIPISGALITPNVIEPETPIVIVYGRLLKTVWNAAKTATNAIPLVVCKSSNILSPN